MISRGRRLGARALLFHSATIAVCILAASMAFAQLLPSPAAVKAPPRLPVVNPAREMLSVCDQMVLNATGGIATRPSASPPLHMADGMPLQGYDFDRAHTGYSLATYPLRPAIVDTEGNTVLVRGEAVEVVVRVFARDSATLQRVLTQTQVQCLNNAAWVNRRSLASGDYTPPTNVRTYKNTGKTSCPPKALPYYWTTISLKVVPEFNDRRIRLICDVGGFATAEVPLKFRTWHAAVTEIRMPDEGGRSERGRRDFYFKVVAAPGTDLGSARLAYIETSGALGSPHRAAVDVSSGSPRVINGVVLMTHTARGRLPFERRYTDDAGAGRAEVVRHANDESAVAIKSGKTVQYAILGVSGMYVPSAGTFVMPDPLTIAIMGDSFAAGEGAPDLDGQHPWLRKDDDHVGDPDDRTDCIDCGLNCHRSRFSGSFRAVNQFIKESNRACDYVFVACSGAVVQDLISQAQPTGRESDGSPGLLSGQVQPMSQIDLVRAWRDRKAYGGAKCVVVGIGGNNSGFADVIKSALGPGDGIGDGAKAIAREGLQYLEGPNGYSKLDSELKSRLGVESIVIHGYPDVVHGSDGSVCLTDCHPENAAATLKQEDLTYSVEFLNALNARIRVAARQPGWKYADVFNATRNHGVCNCSQPFFNTWTTATGLTLVRGFALIVGAAVLPSSLRAPCSGGNQALPSGASCAFHPNERGYREYVAPILSQLKALYPN